MKLTVAERKRIKEIKACLSRFKRRKFDTSTWEATFFLKILDRLKIK